MTSDYCLLFAQLKHSRIPHYGERFQTELLPSFPLCLGLPYFLAGLCDPTKEGNTCRDCITEFIIQEETTEVLTTLGPGRPWTPGCPCTHLQVALPLPAVKPISAYPPHCWRTSWWEQADDLLKAHVGQEGKSPHTGQLTYHTGQLAAAFRVCLIRIAGHLHLLQIHLHKYRRSIYSPSMFFYLECICK